MQKRLQLVREKSYIEFQGIWVEITGSIIKRSELIEFTNNKGKRVGQLKTTKKK